MTISSDSLQGSRPDQQDRYFVKYFRNGVLFGVADGHGGSETSEWVKKTLPSIFEKTHSVEQTFEEVQYYTRDFKAGSTLSFAYLDTKTNIVELCSIGDSPIFIITPDKKLWTSDEDNARSNEKERNKAISKGAIYSGGYLRVKKDGGGIQLSRSLGDVKYDSFLGRQAHLNKFELLPQTIICITSDGVINPKHEDMQKGIEEVAKLVEEGATATDIVQNAIYRHTNDNVTAIICRI